MYLELRHKYSGRMFDSINADSDDVMVEKMYDLCVLLNTLVVQHRSNF